MGGPSGGGTSPHLQRRRLYVAACQQRAVPPRPHIHAEGQRLNALAVEQEGAAGGCALVVVPALAASRAGRCSGAQIGEGGQRDASGQVLAALGPARHSTARLLAPQPPLQGARAPTPRPSRLVRLPFSECHCGLPLGDSWRSCSRPRVRSPPSRASTLPCGTAGSFGLASHSTTSTSSAGQTPASKRAWFRRAEDTAARAHTRTAAVWPRRTRTDTAHAAGSGACNAGADRAGATAPAGGVGLQISKPA